MISTYALILLFIVVIAGIIIYIVNSFVMPKKIGDIQKLIESGKTKVAIKSLNEMLAKDNRDPYAHFLLAEAHRVDGNHQFAILEYRQVLKFGRFDHIIKEVNIRSALAKIYKEKKSFEEAKKELLVLTKLDSTNFEVFFELGVMLFNLGNLDKATECLKKSALLKPEHDQSFFYLGMIEYKKGLFIDSKPLLQNAIKLDAKNYQAHYFLGLVLMKLTEMEPALKEFEIAAKSDELKLKSIIARGMCFVEQSQFHKAMVEFERGLKFAKSGTEVELDIRYRLAKCQEKIRDIQSAIINWEKIFEVNPRFKDVKTKLATYAEFRQDDRIKDFMIAGLAEFELTARKIVARMNLNITDLEIISDTEIEILAVETEGKWRNSRQFNKIIRINRTTEALPDTYFRTVYDTMKPRNATTILIITTGDVSPKALEFVNTRPVNIKGKSELAELLKKI